MKKTLFTAALAIVAIAGAFASKSKVFTTGSFYTVSANTSDITCNSGTALCSASYPGTTAYDKPASDPTRVVVDLSTYEHR